MKCTEKTSVVEVFLIKEKNMESLNTTYNSKLTKENKNKYLVIQNDKTKVIDEAELKQNYICITNNLVIEQDQNYREC